MLVVAVVVLMYNLEDQVDRVVVEQVEIIMEVL
jgi:hypothetical protein